MLTVRWLLYATGLLGLFLVNAALMSMLLYRYDPGITNSQGLPILVSSALVGFALFVGRVFGAVSQPIIGYLSDRCWSKWGQRRPFLAASILPLLASFLLLFMPLLDQPQLFSFLYLASLLCLFYQAFAIYQVPYLAWLPSLAPTPEQRVKLSTLIAIASLIGTMIGGIGAPWLTEQYSFRGMAIVISTISFVTLLIPLGVTEDLLKPGSADALSLWSCFRLGWQNSTFRSYIAGVASAWIAVTILSVCPAFIAVALLHQEMSFGAVVIAIVLGSAVGGFGLVIPLTRRWGKKRIFQVSMLWSGCGLLALTVLPLWTNAMLPWLVLLMLSSLGLASFFILPNAMLPDVIDQDMRQSGQRREAAYFGARGLLVEISVGVGSLLAGVLLVLGKTSLQPWGVLLAIALAGFFSLVAAWVFATYPITE
jgi:glycoside/pentoside/hexuronide:cation symporter, GPH family